MRKRITAWRTGDLDFDFASPFSILQITLCQLRPNPAHEIQEFLSTEIHEALKLFFGSRPMQEIWAQGPKTLQIPQLLKFHKIAFNYPLLSPN